jgi:hypothetical protein
MHSAGRVAVGTIDAGLAANGLGLVYSPQTIAHGAAYAYSALTSRNTAVFVVSTPNQNHLLVLTAMVLTKSTRAVATSCTFGVSELWADIHVGGLLRKPLRPHVLLKWIFRHILHSKGAESRRSPGIAHGACHG